MQSLRTIILPTVLMACAVATGCTSTQTNTLGLTTTTEPVLPETVNAVPFDAAGTKEDGARSLAREVEVNAGPAAYIAPRTSGSLAAVEKQAEAETQTAAAPVDPGNQQAAAPMQVAAVAQQDEKSLVQTVVEAPVNAAKATAVTIGDAVLPAGPAKGDGGIGHTRPAPEGRVGPASVEARSPELDQLMRHYANYYEVPEELVRRVAKRESTFNPRARNGRYMGLMQIAPATARGMGYRGQPAGLLDAETNLKYAVRYLRGAYVVAKGNHGVADRLYQTGYYYHAKRAGLLDETGVGTDRKRRRRL